jgi:hypothetical protein
MSDLPESDKTFLQKVRQTAMAGLDKVEHLGHSIKEAVIGPARESSVVDTQALKSQGQDALEPGSERNRTFAACWNCTRRRRCSANQKINKI